MCEVVALVCIFRTVAEEPVLLFFKAVVQPSIVIVLFLGHIFENWKPMSFYCLLADVLAHPFPFKKEG